MIERRLSIEKVEIMRRSWAISHQVTETDAHVLFAELNALLLERRELRRTIGQLAAP